MPWWEAACLYQPQRLPTPSVAEAHCSLFVASCTHRYTHYPLRDWKCTPREAGSPAL